VGRVAKKAGAYHHGDLRRVLLEAAIRVVEKEGVGGLSLQAIARKAGVSSGAPYHHFESREQLLAEIALEGYAKLAAEMARGAAEAEAAPRVAETSAEAHVRGLGTGYIRFGLGHRGHFRIMFRPEVKAQLADRRDAVDEAFAMLTSGIARCQEEGVLPPGDPRPFILLAWSAVHGATALWVDGPLEDDGLVDGAALAPLVAGTLVGLLRNEGPGKPRK
jgi:AcrR family transcriptional regulator